MGYKKTIKNILLLEKLGYLFLTLSIILFQIFPCGWYFIALSLLLIIIAYVFDFNYPCVNFYNKKDFLERSVNFSLHQTYIFSVISLIIIIPLNIYGFGDWYGVFFIPIVAIFLGLLEIFLFRKFGNYICKKETLHFVYRQKLKRIIKRTFIIIAFIVGNMFWLYLKK
ncbi:MAG: hypothetical protein LBN95_12455 [Prevotellaceae bacterium]|jgi:hypothetical protein|nr:hypothetical protein [Prevotellaceae bacterium]